MLVVMLKLRDRMTAGTPDFQLGGQPLGSCAEHLVAVNMILETRLAQRRPTVIHLYNMRKCFDQVNLWDVAWEASQIGVRDLHFLMNINQDIKMRICSDDHPDAHFVARDLVRQGMVLVSGLALAIAQVMNRRFQCKSDKLQVGDVEVDPCGFVNDLLSLDNDAKGGKDSCA